MLKRGEKQEAKAKPCSRCDGEGTGEIWSLPLCSRCVSDWHADPQFTAGAMGVLALGHKETCAAYTERTRQWAKMSRYARRTDSNHAEIVTGLRAAGVWVCDTSRLGGGFPDLLCWRAGRTVLLEVKDGRKPPSARKLTEAEQAFFDNFPGEVHVVACVEDALAVMGLRRCL